RTFAGRSISTVEILGRRTGCRGTVGTHSQVNRREGDPMSTRAGKKSTALARREVDTDERLVNEALRHIQAITRRAVLEGTVEIGDYLVATFFGGDLELASSNSPTKENALRQLLAR